MTEYFTPILSKHGLVTLASVLLAFAFAAVVRGMARVRPLPLVEGGTRGMRRSEALGSPGFRAIEPALRHAGGIVRVLVGRLRRLGKGGRAFVEAWEEHATKQLIWAGEPAGLERHEFSAICLILSACAASIVGIWGNGVWVLPVALLALVLPYFRLQSLADARFSEVAHDLPGKIDLLSLCMSAGADLPGALRRVTEDRRGVVAKELGYLLASLDLGITRAAALLALRERLPVREVKDLVRAILLAEKKGTSIADALAQQARAGRQRRSVRAEETAARAGVLLLVPLMLLMACIMLLLVGPLLCGQLGF